MNLRVAFFNNVTRPIIDYFDRKPSVGLVILDTTGNENLRKITDPQERVTILAHLEKAGYEDPEDTLQAFEVAADVFPELAR